MEQKNANVIDLEQVRFTYILVEEHLDQVGSVVRLDEDDEPVKALPLFALRYGSDAYIAFAADGSDDDNLLNVGAIVVDGSADYDAATSDYRNVQSIRDMNDFDWQVIGAACEALACILPENEDIIAKIRS